MAIEINIDGYDSLEQIAVGGMAAVYKARKVSIDKVVAIKVLFPYLACDERFIERFQREAKSAARVQHENIVNVLDFGGSDGCYYIVMEFYHGLTIADLLKEHDRIPLDIAVSVILDVCFGLEAAHATGIVHRDIKPANIIFTHQGGIKIADFGLAKKSDTMTVVTQPGKVLGTPAYMSPEQAAGHNVGAQSDIFSLGVVGYELFCHRRPFEGSSYSEVLEKIQTNEMPSLTHENPLVRPDFERIIARMLEKDLTARYASVTEVIADLERAMETYEFKRDRRKQQQYMSDADGYLTAFNEQMVSRCLSQGTYFMQRGATHITDAVQEFKRILYVDPTNEPARKHLAVLMAKHSDSDQTVTLDARGLPGARTKAEPHSGGAESDKRTKSPRAKEKPGRIRFSWPTLFVLVAVLLATVGWGWSSLRTPAAINAAPLLSSPSRLTVSEGETVEFGLKAVDPDGDAVRIFADSLPPGAVLGPAGGFVWEVGFRQAGSYNLEFFADDGVAMGAARTVIEVADKPDPLDSEPLDASSSVAASKEISPPKVVSKSNAKAGSIPKANVISKPKAKALSAPKVIPEPEVKVVSAAKVFPEPKAKVIPEPPAIRYGALSVYFLGGVGEFYLDGNKLEQQPPFTGVAVATGRYGASCRMFHEEDSREFDVTIEEGHNTIIEYVVGDEPVIMHEQINDE